MDKKIIIFGQHFASINTEFYNDFQTKLRISNLTAWIKEKILIDFSIDMKSSNELNTLNTVIQNYYYASKKEWLNEKMRDAIKVFDATHKNCNEVICYRFQDINKEFISSPILNKDFILNFLESDTLLQRIERNYLGLYDVDGSTPIILSRILLSFTFMSINEYVTKEEYEIIKSAVKGSDYEIKLEKMVQKASKLSFEV